MVFKELEIQGFKSFPDKVKISFDTGVTGVVGPNGSGKSNLSDAVRWVLGETSSRQLRAAGKMEPEYSYGVVSIPHESKGEQIVLVTNNEKVTSAMLHEYVKNNGMSELYLPRVILYHEKLPVFATGKADNVTLKKEVMAELCSVENAA